MIKDSRNRRKSKKNNKPTIVRCKECEYLMFSDMYGECAKGYMGIVRPDDYCSRGKREKSEA